MKARLSRSRLLSFATALALVAIVGMTLQMAATAPFEPTDSLAEERAWEAWREAEQSREARAMDEAIAALDAFTRRHDLRTLDASHSEQLVVCQVLEKELHRLSRTGERNPRARAEVEARLNRHRERLAALQALLDEYDQHLAAVDDARTRLRRWGP